MMSACDQASNLHGKDKEGDFAGDEDLAAMTEISESISKENKEDTEDNDSVQDGEMGWKTPNPRRRAKVSEFGSAVNSEPFSSVNIFTPLSENSNPESPTRCLLSPD